MSNREGHEQEIEAKTREKLKDLPDYLNQFYYRMTANGMQATTKRSYIGYCVNFLKYFSPDLTIDPNDITDSDIDKYMDSITYINGKKASVSSRATKLSALKTFFGFMKERGIIERDPTKSIRPPKNKGLNPVVYLTETEIKMVEHTIRTGAGSHKAKAKQKKWRNRDLAIYFLFLSTGVRVEALSEIDVEDIDFHDKKLIVIDKGEKEIIHFLSDQLIEYIQIWLEDREKFLTEKGKEEKALFLNTSLNRLGATGIRRMIKKYTANLDKKITPHKLRSTFATMVYQKTGDIYLASQMIAHENINTTKRYAACVEESKREASDMIGDVLF